MNSYISGHVYCLAETLYLNTVLKLLCVSLIYVKPLHIFNTVLLFLAFYQALSIGISCCVPEKMAIKKENGHNSNLVEY